MLKIDIGNFLSQQFHVIDMSNVFSIQPQVSYLIQGCGTAETKIHVV